MRPLVHGLPNLGSLGTCAVFLAFAQQGQAQTVDLVNHNGFEACWSRALTEPDFLLLHSATIEGAPGCLLANPGGDPEICTASMCAGGVPGCPITLHAGQFSTYLINLVGGYMEIDATSGLDPFSGSLNTSGLSCTFNVINTTNVVASYGLHYPLQLDGNNGYYTTALSLGTVSVTGLTSNDVTITGGITCSFLNPGTAFFTNSLSQAIAESIPMVLPPATVGQSLCPLTPMP